MPSETAKASLGYVTSYGAARRGGYQGTYEEWCALMAEVADHLEENIQLNEDSQAAKAAAETAELEAEAAALTAESWAKGTKGGTDVPSTDPAYHDNAKYYAGEAEDQKDLAEQAASAAAGSAETAEGHSTDAEAWAAGTRGGEDVESGDDAYHNNAKYYSEQSSGFADDAAGSASDAEAWAKGTKNGTDVPSTDPTYHNNAKYWSEQAEETAEDIEASSAQIAQNASDIGDLKTQLNDYVELAGENQVTPQNISGVTFTKTSEEIPGPNIFSDDLLFREGQYVIESDGKLAVGSNTSLNSYVIPVDGSKYTFTQARFAVLANGTSISNSPTVGTTQQNITEIDTTGASYLFLSFSTSVIANAEIHKIIEGEPTYSDFVMPDWTGIPALQSKLSDTDNRVYDLEYINGLNLFSRVELLYEDGYASISNGKISAKNPYSGMNAYLILVDGKSIYTFTMCRFAFLVDSDKQTAIGDLLQNVTRIDSTGASYICFSFDYNIYPLANYEIIGKKQKMEKPKFAYVSGGLASGGNLQLTNPKNNLRKGERIVFEGNITSFGSLEIGLTYGTTMDASQRINTFVIDGTNISYYEKRNTSTPAVVAHGLTLTNNIQVIWEMSETATCKITLISNGESFEHEFTNFVRQTIGNPYVLSVNTVLTDCKLSWTCLDLNKNIWMFGDSYFAYSTNRWTYYLHEYGYDDNILLDGFPGEGGANGRVSFNNLLNYGTPKYAVWCLGMNDTSDSETAPATNWVSARDYFLAYCMNNGVTPIFGTIPTVPTINHEQKNAWIRSSGYRYIDFAKAVGAQSNGTWFSGMLDTDGVHPTARGAKALFAQVLIDLPEIMVSDFGYIS